VWIVSLGDFKRTPSPRLVTLAALVIFVPLVRLWNKSALQATLAVPQVKLSALHVHLALLLPVPQLLPVLLVPPAIMLLTKRVLAVPVARLVPSPSVPLRRCVKFVLLASSRRIPVPPPALYVIQVEHRVSVAKPLASIVKLAPMLQSQVYLLVSTVTLVSTTRPGNPHLVWLAILVLFNQALVKLHVLIVLWASTWTPSGKPCV